MQEKEIEIFDPTNLSDWRKWLEKNHLSKQSVWLVCYNKNSGKKSIAWSESVDVALCFGWIDSKKIKVDEERTHQFFSKRKARSTWSKINKVKVAQLIEQGLMTDAGYKSIDVAKQNGSWTILDTVENLVIPEDLRVEFEKNTVAGAFFDGMSKSSKKAVLQWLVLAKTAETRQKRIAEIVECAAQNLKPKHLR
ncbi:YdeI/OmpD-associated family protein [Pedobacter sp. GR22-6]|uniref:YdeI/OmpD-associated family protein n=1 Tax=Pedobacter sp. GR22-6 TaxID=3127957 RepID=UPI00307DF63C